jgi:hypothetical protein
MIKGAAATGNSPSGGFGPLIDNLHNQKQDKSMNEGPRYSITTWRDSAGDRKWSFTIRKYVRVTGRVGWKWVKTTHDSARFDSRLDALAAAGAAVSIDQRATPLKEATFEGKAAI